MKIEHASQSNMELSFIFISRASIELLWGTVKKISIVERNRLSPQILKESEFLKKNDGFWDENILLKPMTCREVCVLQKHFLTMKATLHRMMNFLHMNLKLKNCTHYKVHFTVLSN